MDDEAVVAFPEEARERPRRDAVTKPEPAQHIGQLRTLLAALQAGAGANTPKPFPAPHPPQPATPALAPLVAPIAMPRPGMTPRIVAVGASTGGPVALSSLVARLPRNLQVPVVVVQHMPPVFTAALVHSLASKTALKVVEAEHGRLLEPGVIYVAPGGRHLEVAPGARGRRVAQLTDAPAENFCRPAVDVLFRSVARVYGERAMAVILTGMGRDGTAGLKEMKRFGVRVVGQSEGSCTVYGMPREAKAAGVVDVELPVERIAEDIVRTLGREPAAS
ncbi:MAG: CheB methylesterase domain-containing protein [Myxococcales bacterium]